MKVLILGGTSDARALAQSLDGDGRFDVVTSLAGRVRDPLLPAGRVRVGGFGGVDGLASWIREHDIGAVVDATHPFAAQISENAVAAGATTSIPVASLRRRAWVPGPGDRWTAAASVQDAATIVGDRPRRVFLTIGRQGVGAFGGDATSWFLVRSIDPPDADLPPQHELLLARGPFTVDAERDLMRSRRIDLIVSKNSGGAMTEAKLLAARELGLPVVMIERPRPSNGDLETDSVADVVTWLDDHL